MPELTYLKPDHRLRRSRAVLTLARERLRQSNGGWIAFFFGLLLAVGFLGAAVVLRISDGTGAHLEGLVHTAARCMTWGIGLPLAYAASGDRRADDRHDGVEALVAARGLSVAGFDAARVLAAMLQTAMSLAFPLVLLVLLTAGVAGSSSLGLSRAMLAVRAIGFAALAGATLGGLGALCGRFGRGQGRWVLFVFLVVPWVLAGLGAHKGWSVEGAIEAALAFALPGGSASR